MSRVVDEPMSADELDQEYNPDGNGQHPVHTRSEWRIAVEQQNTVAGYWQWLAGVLEEESHHPGAAKKAAKAHALAMLRKATMTQIAHWDAMNELETAFGFPNGEIDSHNDETLVESVKMIAAGANSDSSVMMYHVDQLAKDMRVKW